METVAADLPAIGKELVKIGQIVDDQSLLRIGYCEDESTERVQSPCTALLTSASSRARKILDEAAALSPAHPSLAELRARLQQL